MTQYTVRESVKPVPPAMAGRPVDHRGFPVPWFVTKKDANGLWDFVEIQSSRFDEAVRLGVCWVSGEKLGAHKSFVVGPMCVVTGTAGDPPVKRDIGLWSARVCPFLSRPLALRDDRFTPEQLEAQRGLLLTHNPGVCAVYTTKSYQYNRLHNVFFMGPPESVEWFCKGVPATYDEVKAAMRKGLPKVLDAAASESPAAMRELDAKLHAVEKLLPPQHHVYP